MEGELGRPDCSDSLCIRRVEQSSTHLHLAGGAGNRQQVDALHRRCPDDHITGVVPIGCVV